jgi:predicted lipoprotein with Yx(FWY)xxD motif
MKLKSIASLGITLIVVAIVAVVTAGGGSAKNTQAQAAGVATVSVRHTGLGETLVGPNGRTLYLFKGDKSNVSTLSAAGRAVWPPLTGTVKAGSGVQASKLGTTHTGFKQVTYNGHPLYYYIGDTAPGSTKGQHLKEFGALWFVLSTNGNANTATAKAASPSPPAPAPAPTSSYGY